MKSVIASSALVVLAAAQRPSGAGFAGPFSAFPSCAGSCATDHPNTADYSSLCTNTTAIDTLNSCVDSSSCSGDDKSNVYEAVAQLCADAGATVTASPEATFSATSGTSEGKPGAAWGPQGSWATASSQWSSWATGNGWPTAVPSQWSSLGSEFSSWTSAASLTARPTDAAQWSSLTSAHPLPSGLANGFVGGSAWPSAWSTASGWTSLTTGGPWNGGAGWSDAGGHGPFGGPDNGWGPWASESTGSWTAGPWTSWWGTNGCPASTWSGWTSGTWSTDAAWTSWSGCTASTTATAVSTTTVTTGGATSVSTVTNYGIQVAAVSTAGSTSSRSSGAAMPTNFLFAGSAAGAVGVLAGAILL